MPPFAHVAITDLIGLLHGMTSDQLFLLLSAARGMIQQNRKRQGSGK
jgi:hypothetical protein